jgi:hypothetical protein
VTPRFRWIALFAASSLAVFACAQGEDPNDTAGDIGGDFDGGDIDGGNGTANGDQDGGGVVPGDQDSSINQGKNGGNGGATDAATKDAAGKTAPDGSTGGGTDSGSSSDSGTTVDAGVDANCVVTTTNLLTNPGFDTGLAPWAQNPTGIIDTPPHLPVTPQAGNYAAWLGGDLNATDTLFQKVMVPATTTSLHVKGYKWFTTQDVPGFDVLSIQTRTSSGTKLEELASLSPSKDDTKWVAFDYTVPTTHAGQTIELALISDTDDSLNTNFFIDSLEVDATYCK